MFKTEFIITVFKQQLNKIRNFNSSFSSQHYILRSQRFIIGLTHHSF